MAPIFVGSNSDDTRVRSNRVGLAASTSNPGTASEGDGYYNSSDNQLKFYDGSSWSAIQGSGTVSVVASGSLPNGAPVILQSDGKVSAISTTTIGVNTSAAVTYDNAIPYYNKAVYDASNEKVVVVYYDTGDSGKGKVIIGTVSGSSISFGSPITMSFDVVIPSVDIAYDSSEGVIIFAYKSQGAGNGQAQYGTVSGSSITFSGTTTFEPDDLDHISVDYDPNVDKFLIAYRAKQHSNRASCIVGYNNGGTPAFGDEFVLEPNGSATNIKVMYHPGVRKMLAAYTDGGSGYSDGVCRVVTINEASAGGPDDVTITNKVMFSQKSTSYITMAYDSNAEKAVLGYFNEDQEGRVVVSNVTSGIGSISFASPTTVYTGDGGYHAMTYDTKADKILFMYSPNSDGNKPYIAVCDVSGNDISVASTHRLNNPSSPLLFADIAYDSDAQKAVAVYANQQTNVGNAHVFTTPYHTTNLTTENFIGFSDAAYTDGQTATIQIVSTVDDAQSGLTTGTALYVTNNGNLSTTVGVPSVFAGTAISDTEILIKQ